MWTVWWRCHQPRQPRTSGEIVYTCHSKCQIPPIVSLSSKNISVVNCVCFGCILQNFGLQRTQLLRNADSRLIYMHSNVHKYLDITFQQTKCKLNWIQVSLLNWPLLSISCLFFNKSRGLFFEVRFRLFIVFHRCEALRNLLKDLAEVL